MRPFTLATITYVIWTRVEFAENGKSEITERKLEKTPSALSADFLEKYEIEYNEVNPKPVDHKIRELRPTSSIVYETDSSYSGSPRKGEKHRRHRDGEETPETPTDESPKQLLETINLKRIANDTPSRGKNIEFQKLEKRDARVKIGSRSRERRRQTDKVEKKSGSGEGRRETDDLEKKSTSSREESQKTERLSKKSNSCERRGIRRGATARHRSVTPKRNRKPNALSRKSSESDIEKVKVVFGKSPTLQHFQPRNGETSRLESKRAKLSGSSGERMRSPDAGQMLSRKSSGSDIGKEKVVFGESASFERSQPGIEETSRMEPKRVKSSSSSAERMRKLEEKQQRLRSIRGKSPKSVILDEDSEGFVRSKHVTHVKKNEKTGLVSFETESTHFRKPKTSFPRRFEYLPDDDDDDDIAQQLQKQCSLSLNRLTPQPSPTREELLELTRTAARETIDCVAIFKDVIKNILGKPESKNYFRDTKEIEQLYKDLKKPSKRNTRILFWNNSSCNLLREYWRKLCVNLFTHLYFHHKPMKPSFKRIEDNDIQCVSKWLKLKHDPNTEYLEQEVLACPIAADRTNKRKWLYVSTGYDERSYFVYSPSKQNVIRLSAHLQY